MIIRDLEEDEESISAPHFSPIHEIEFDELSSGSEELACNEEDDGSISSDDQAILTVQCSPDPQEMLLSSDWKEFKLVGDNIDRNIRASFQRIGHNKVLSLFSCLCCLG